MHKQELENRLILFAVAIIKITELLPKTRAGITLADQLVRSGTSPALNFGEAQSAESHRDFIHKNQIILKELRETYIGLKIIREAAMIKNTESLETGIIENNELISIFVSTINTLKKKT